MDEALIPMVAWLVNAAAVLVAGTTLYNFYKAALALRAKRRGSLEVSRSIEVDAKLRQAIRHLSSEQDAQLVAQQVEQILESLPDKDKRVLLEGLHQPNKAGAKRFLKEVAAA